LTKASKHVVGSLQVAYRRSLLRRRVRAVVAGTALALAMDLVDADLDPSSVLLEVTRSVRSGSPILARLLAALQASGALAALLDGLVDDDTRRQERCARLAGALRLDAAVPWLGMLLHAPERPVRLAAARSLGRIGGVRSADLLMGALRARQLPPSRLAIELSRAAPDLYIESILWAPQNTAVRAQLAAAAGLRSRLSALEPLRSLALSGTERERATACRALGLIGDPAAGPELCVALEHRAWRVRRAATRALGVIGDRSHLPALHERLYDPHPSNRYAAARALRLVRTGRRK
jgi:HEAT repeat protein